MDKEIEILAKTIYGETTTPSVSNAESIANVILNRVKYAKSNVGHWWGNCVSEVCLKPMQFKCWDIQHPNHEKLAHIRQSDPFFTVCRRIAVRAIKGLLNDNTKGATCYHDKNCHPQWAYAAVPCADIGGKLFYTII